MFGPGACLVAYEKLKSRHCHRIGRTLGSERSNHNHLNSLLVQDKSVLILDQVNKMVDTRSGGYATDSATTLGLLVLQGCAEPVGPIQIHASQTQNFS